MILKSGSATKEFAMVNSVQSSIKKIEKRIFKEWLKNEQEIS